MKNLGLDLDVLVDFGVEWDERGSLGRADGSLVWFEFKLGVLNSVVPIWARLFYARVAFYVVVVVVPVVAIVGIVEMESSGTVSDFVVGIERRYLDN